MRLSFGVREWAATPGSAAVGASACERTVSVGVESCTSMQAALYVLCGRKELLCPAAVMLFESLQVPPALHVGASILACLGKTRACATLKLHSFAAKETCQEM